VHIIRLSKPGILLWFLQFIERTGTVGSGRKKAVESPGDNPRRLGKGWVKAGWPGSSQVRPLGRMAEAEFTSSSGSVRALSVTRNRNCAARIDEKPFRAESSNTGRFRACVNRSCPEGTRLLLRTGTERVTLADLDRVRRPKTPKGETKRGPRREANRHRQGRRASRRPAVLQ
jgi:hypothetical protein